MALLTTSFTLLAVAALIQTARRPAGFRALRVNIRATPVLGLSLALFAWAAFRTMGSQASPALALRGLLEYHELLLLPFLAGIALDAPQRRRALIAFIAGNLVAAMVSYARFAGLLPELSPPMNFAPPRGPIGGGWMMALAAFFCVVLLRGARPRARLWLLAAIAALLGVLLYLIAGRTAYLSLISLAALLLVGASRRQWASGLLALVVAFALAWTISPYMRERIVDTFVQPPEAARVNSTGIRLEFYRVTALLALDAPILGHGTGSFQQAYGRKAALLGSPGLPSGNPHNQYLLFAAETGLPGALLFGAVLIAAWRQARRLRPEAALLVRGLSLTMAIACVFNSFLLDGAEGRAFALLLALALMDRWPAGRPTAEAG